MQKYSIVMCTYNGEKYIKEQLDSFLLQKFLPDELIICDDGSTDSTLDIVNEFKNRASFTVNVNVNTQNLGVTKNFFKAANLVKNNIIFFSDQDDIWLESKAEKILKIFNEKPLVELVFTDATTFLNNEETGSLWKSFYFNPKRLKKHSQFNAMISGNFCTGATMAIRKSLLYSTQSCIENSNYNNMNLYHDYLFAILASTNNSMYALNEKLIKYRLHENQQAGIPKKMSIKQKLLKQKNKQINSKTQLIEFLNVNNLLTDLIEQKLNKAILFDNFRGRIASRNFICRFFISFAYLLAGKYHLFTKRPFLSFAKDVVSSVKGTSNKEDIK